jgi:hypothetical protein
MTACNYNFFLIPPHHRYLYFLIWTGKYLQSWYHSINSTEVVGTVFKMHK